MKADKLSTVNNGSFHSPHGSYCLWVNACFRVRYSLLDNGTRIPALEQRRMTMFSGFSFTASHFASFPAHMLFSRLIGLLLLFQTPHSISCHLVFTHVGDSWPFPLAWFKPAHISGHCLSYFFWKTCSEYPFLLHFLPCSSYHLCWSACLSLMLSYKPHGKLSCYIVFGT